MTENDPPLETKITNVVVGPVSLVDHVMLLTSLNSFPSLGLVTVTLGTAIATTLTTEIIKTIIITLENNPINSFFLLIKLHPQKNLIKFNLNNEIIKIELLYKLCCEIS